MTAVAVAPAVTPPPDALPVRRLNALRGAYVFVALGVALVKWPVLADPGAVPLMDGVVAALLTAVSLLALLGLRHPVRLLPVLVFEVLWKAVWLSAVALPAALRGDVDAATADVVVSCAFVLPVVVAVPWRYAWRQHVAAPGDRWR